MKRTRTALIFLIITVAVLCFSFMSVAVGTTPVLYRNDTKYTITDYPAEIIDGKIHVPISFFIGLHNIQYEYGMSPAGFYLRNSTTGRYMSFSSDSMSIIVDGSLVNVTFPIENSTVYLPLEFCCDVLSLNTEKISDKNTERIRVSDGTQKLSFDELIELYDPTVTQPEDPTVIEPEKPVDPIEPIQPSDRYAYIIFDLCPNEYTDGIMDTLKDSGIKATFFFDRQGIKENPETVIRAFVEGHGIGIVADSVENADSTNDVLYSVLNFRTRVLMTNEEITNKAKKQASKMGYVLWSSDIDSDSWKEENAKNVARNIYNKTFEKRHNVIRMPSDSKSSDILSQLMYYVSDDKYIIHKIIDPTVKTGGQ